jgi:cell division protein FtsL
MNMSFCAECGARVKGNGIFCTECGSKLKKETYRQKEYTSQKPPYQNSKMPYKHISKILLVCLIIGLVLFLFLAYQQYQKANSLEKKNNQLIIEVNSIQSQIDNLNSEISDLNFEIQTKDSTIESQRIEIELKKQEIQRLQNRVNQLEEELGITKTQLQETTQKYEEAKPYQERVNRGQDLSKYYALLSDNQDYAKPIILQELGLSFPVAPSNDNELWERGRKVYNWISSNYKYCGDKGLRVGTTFYEFQFFSPDELLMSDNARCGDCDDFATLFAGLMYASGVPEDKVWVVCGTVPGGGHCWNWLSLFDTTYRIDSVCSQKQTIISMALS